MRALVTRLLPPLVFAAAVLAVVAALALVPYLVLPLLGGATSYASCLQLVSLVVLLDVAAQLHGGDHQPWTAGAADLRARVAAWLRRDGGVQ